MSIRALQIIYALLIKFSGYFNTVSVTHLTYGFIVGVGQDVAVSGYQYFLGFSRALSRYHSSVLVRLFDPLDHRWSPHQL